MTIRILLEWSFRVKRWSQERCFNLFDSSSTRFASSEERSLYKTDPSPYTNFSCVYGKWFASDTPRSMKLNLKRQGSELEKEGKVTTEGTVPAHKPCKPSSLTMLLMTAEEFLCGFCFDCSLVFTRSIGLVAQAARAPERDPAATFLTTELLSFVAPKTSFMGL